MKSKLTLVLRILLGAFMVFAGSGKFIIKNRLPFLIIISDFCYNRVNLCKSSCEN